LEHFLAAEAEIINPSQVDENGWVVPPAINEIRDQPVPGSRKQNINLVEIPADFLSLKAANIELAREWRTVTRSLFEGLFESGYLATDFVHLPGDIARSYYVLSNGEGTL
jgi:predicted GNAT superfamily acetyltransferase